MTSVDEAFDEHEAVLAATRAVLPSIRAAAELIGDRINDGRKVLCIGNGGSAADAQHFASELSGRFELDRRALPALALTVDTSAITAIANDLGYEQVFARQLEALAGVGDVVVALSASGTSANVVTGAVRARELGCAVVALTGRSGGDLAPLADVVVAVPSDTVARIQELHALVLHAVVGSLEHRWGGAP